MKSRLGSTTSLLAIGVCASLSLTTGSKAYAAPDNDSAGQVEELVVTAQRREESLQDVPVSITALSGSALAERGVKTTQELDFVTPGLVSTVSAGTSQRYIRGVGAQITSLLEQPVAAYVNGVYVPSSTGSMFSFNNIERIEVLKGPQGTLFGRNATGGVIQVITKAPNADPSLDLRASYASYQTAEISAFGNAPLAEGLAANAALYWHDQGKGYGRNFVLGDRINALDDLAGRVELLFTPNDALSVRWSADYGRQDTDIGLARNVLPPSRTVLGAGQVGDPLDATSNVSPYSHNEQWGISQELSLKLGGVRLRSITGYHEYRYTTLYDADVTPTDLLKAFRHEKLDAFQQEFLADGQVGKLQWTAGVFFLKTDAIDDPVTTFGLSPTGNVTRFTDQSVKSYAAYAQGTYSLTDRLNVTAGIRYTRDTNIMNGRFVSAPGFPGGAGQTLSVADNVRKKVSKPTWRLAIDYKPTDDTLIYASYNRGFKSGAFNKSNISQPATRPEILDAYEAGFKSEFFDRTVRLNVSAFHYDYKDIQITAVNLPTLILINAASGRSDGAEVELTMLPKVPYGRLQFDVGASILKAKYKEFPNSPYFLPNPYTAVPAGIRCPTPSSAAAGGNTTCEYDASGQRMLRSPKWTLTTNVQYTMPLRAGDLKLAVTYYYNDGFYWETSNRSRQKPYEIWNAELTFNPGNGPWRIRAFGRNLGDETYYSSVSESSFGDVSTAQAPRVIGIGVDYRWGGV